MKRLVLAVCLASAAGGSATGAVQTAESPYKGQEQRAIKALSPEDVEALLDGRGMGLAKAAELNGYPGPKHVLELATQLELTGEQTRAVQRAFDAMQDGARRLGSELVEAERRLDEAFASEAIDPARLEALVGAIADVAGRLRVVHLSAHLETRDLLTLPQRHRYANLRGYAQGQHNPEH